MASKLIVILFLGISYKPIIYDPNYHHDPLVTQPRDIVREFRAYIVSFDSDDDGISLGIPEWVAYEIKPQKEVPKAPARPSRWIHSDGSPPDESYKGSGYDRGHLCMKQHAWRLGANADWNTHTTLNACPMLPEFNRGIWLDMENQCARWADESGASVWVICGPVLYGYPDFIGDKGEVPVAIPDAFYKIMVRQTGDTCEALALLYPHSKFERPYDHRRFVVSVDYVENLTKLNFLTLLPDNVESIVESRSRWSLWHEESKK